MDELAKLKELGESMGYTGVELRDFIKEQQDIQREDRAARREQEKLDRLADKEAEDRKERKEEAARQEKKEIAEAERQEKKDIAERQAQKEIRDEAAKEADKQRAHQLDLANKGAIKVEAHTENSRPRTPKPPPIPAFRDGRDDIDSYLTMFERQAEKQHGWDRSTWATYLASHLQGKALDVYSRMGKDDAEDYDKLKTALLLRYDATAEGYRKKFRTSRPEKGETFAQFEVRQQNYLSKWFEMSQVVKTYDGITDLLLKEHFMEVCNKELRVFIMERKPKTMSEVIVLAEQFREARDADAEKLTHGPAISTPAPAPRPPPISNTIQKKPEFKSIPAQRNFHRNSYEQGDRRMPDQRTCFICHKTGHLAINCPLAQKPNRAAYLAEVRDFMQPQDAPRHTNSSRNDQGSQNSYGHRQPVKNTPTSLQVQDQTQDKNTHQPSSLGCCVTTDNNTQQESQDDSVQPEAIQVYKLTDVCQVANEVHMPVASGFKDALVTVLRDSGCNCVIVRTSKVEPTCLTDEIRAVTLVDGTVIRAPVAHIEIDTPYLTGSVDAVCLEKPVYDLIIGNVMHARPPHHPDPQWHKNVVSVVETRQQTREKEKPIMPMKVPPIAMTDVTPSDLQKAQVEDPTLEKIRGLADEGATQTMKNGSVRWYLKKNLIYREFTSDATNDVNEQLVIPKPYRDTIMRLSHESIMAGHLATKRTSDRVLSSFFWPGVIGDITRFCQSCDICQRTTVKGRVTKVPLGNMPLVDTPFKRVGVDIVGPLVPITDNKNRYILTLIDFATRYPEAVALPSIETERVAEALVDIFSRIGVPEELLTDRGSNFTSAMMDEVSRLLSIKRLLTTPYHPQCNGMVERFNGTLKTMLKRMCSERPKDWDRFLSAALFAYREIPNESTGFSPFHLVYGRTVRGPMMILKDLWTQEVDDQEVKTVYQYVIDLRERLEDTCRLAHENASKASKKHKKIFDSKAKERNMEIGDEALLLLPTDNNKLLLQWRGPYKIVDKLGHCDYKLNINGVDKMFHANLLKKYTRRVTASIAVAEDDDSDDLQLLENTKQGPNDVEVNPDLSTMQKTQLRGLLEEFRDVLTEVPGQTDILQHDIKLTTSEPIRMSYPLPYHTETTVNEEVEKMLQMGIIEPSTSPYTSPIVIVRKKDGSNRFCIDYRRINESTVFDAEPIPNIDDIFKNMSGCQFFSRLDLTSGYWQLPMAPSAKEITAFRSPTGLYQFRVMPFGLVTAPASFTRLMRKLLAGMNQVDNYIDDIIIFTPTYEEHIKVLRAVLGRLRAAHLTAKPKKCVVGFYNVECLGFYVGKDHVTTNPDKIEAIKNAPIPQTKTQVRSFLGMTGFYRKFIPSYSDIALPLTDLTKNKMPNRIKWTQETERSFQTLKDALTKTPILKLPDIEQPFILQTDASDKGLGAVLMQKIDGENKPVAYASKKLKKAEVAYSTIEKECYAIIWAVKKFSRYLYGREFQLETDHRPLSYLHSAKTSNSRLMRWALSLQPYRFRIIAIKGVDNVNADYLSRSINADDEASQKTSQVCQTARVEPSDAPRRQKRQSRSSREFKRDERNRRELNLERHRYYD